jgi:cell division septum initiation protein DivIVA
MLDSHAVMELVDRVRASLPDDLKEAQQILEKREAVLNQALMDARRVKASAEQESKNRVQDTEIVKQAQRRSEEILADAQRRADKIVAEAQRQADVMRQDADRYALEVLSKLEAQLSALLNSARRGIEQLEMAKAA